MGQLGVAVRDVRSRAAECLEMEEGEEGEGMVRRGGGGLRGDVRSRAAERRREGVEEGRVGVEEGVGRPMWMRSVKMR